jgi:hypothetical protein
LKASQSHRESQKRKAQLEESVRLGLGLIRPISSLIVRPTRLLQRLLRAREFLLKPLGWREVRGDDAPARR